MAVEKTCWPPSKHVPEKTSKTKPLDWATAEPADTGATTEGLGASVWASAPSMGLGTRGPGIKENGELFFSWREV